MCQNFLEQKFGRQPVDSGTSNAQKALNGFSPTVYIPTNWRGSYEPHKAKFPAFIKYGGLFPVAPEYFQRNYLGIYPIANQPTIDEGKPFLKMRNS